MSVKGIRILAHRCGQRRGVENTLKALDLARQDGADGAECDVRLTADGEPVLFHDPDLRRAAGRPQRVRELTWRQLSAIAVFGGSSVPHLQDALERLAAWPGGRLTIDLHEERFDLAEKTARVVAASGVASRCAVLAFYSDRTYLQRAREVEPATRLSLMPGAPWNVRPSLGLSPVELCLGWDKPLHRALYSTVCRLYPVAAEIARARAAGVTVSGGIANTPEDVRYFLSQGVDGIWTDDVPMAAATLAGGLGPKRDDAGA